MSARTWRPGDPARVSAACPDEDALDTLTGFDHHVVAVGGVLGILIMYEEPGRAIVVFHPAPAHLATEAEVRTVIRKHPAAPPEVQAIVDGLAFAP